MKEKINELLKRLGIEVTHKRLLLQAFIHESALPDDQRMDSYEPLEFLGDHVLRTYVTAHLVEHYAGCFTFSEITKIVKLFESNQFLAWVSDVHRLPDLLVKSSCEMSEKTKADLVESLLGALFLAGSNGQTRKVVEHLILVHVDIAVCEGHWDPVALLAHIRRLEGGEEPVYVIQELPEEMSDCDRVQVDLHHEGGHVLGAGRTLAAAKVDAANRVLKKYGISI